MFKSFEKPLTYKGTAIIRAKKVVAIILLASLVWKIKRIKIIPRIGPKETANSIVSIRVVSARRNLENNEFRDITIAVEIFVPLTQWIIKDSNLRPFAIMGEIQKSLDNKKINGLGKMIGGEFNLNFLTEEISAYEQSYRIITYD